MVDFIISLGVALLIMYVVMNLLWWGILWIINRD